MTMPAPGERLLIRASAGTGKTYQLTNRIIAHLHRDVDLARILAATFTRNAASEILERVLVRLARAATDAEELQQLSAASGAADLDAARCGKLLETLIGQLQSVRVSTLDSYFHRVATSFCLELGLPLAWQILDRNDVIAFKHRAIQNVIGGARASTMRQLVNLISGSDATRSVSRVLTDVVENLYGVYQEAPSEAWTWIDAPTPATRAEHRKACKRFEQALDSGAKVHRDAIDAAHQRDWHEFVRKGIAAKVASGDADYNGSEIPADIVGAYEEMLAVACSDELHKLASQTTATRELLELFDAEYRELKRQERTLEFDDITRALAESTLSDSPGRLAHRLNGSVDHLLLDEFQDTSPLQWQVLEPLAREVAGEGSDRSFFCVGDQKQAIYGWRGGVASIFGTLEERMPDLERDELVESYRSSPVVIETVNHVFSRLDRHPDLGELAPCVAGWSASFPTHVAHFTDLPGYTVLRTGSSKGEYWDSVAAEIARIAEEANPFEIGVLVRQNKIVAQLVRELRERNVPASQEGGFALTDAEPVRTLLSLAQLADHPGDTLARYHVAHSPLGSCLGLSPDTTPHEVLEIARRVRRELAERGYGVQVGLWAHQLAASADPRERFRLSQVVRLAWRYDERATRRPADWARFVKNTRFGDPTSDRVRVMTLHQAKGLEFPIVVLPELGGSLAGQPGSLAARRPEPTQPPDRVCRTRNKELTRLMPPRVRDVYLSDDVRETEESLCELYVAMTRAQFALHMIIPPSAKTVKTLPATPVGLLRATLTNGEQLAPDLLVNEQGDPDWFRHAEAVIPDDPEEVSLDIRLEPLEGPRRRGRLRVSPSGLAGTPAAVSVSSVFEPGSTAAMDHGTLVHAWMEEITWLEDPPASDTLKDVAARLGIAFDDLDGRIERFLEQLEQPGVRDLMSQTAYDDPASLPFDKATRDLVAAGHCDARVQNEAPFVVDEEGAVLRGTIDRLVLLQREDQVLAADVIDFKTDRLKGSDGLDTKVEHYRGQLQAYSRAVTRLYGLGPGQIATRLVFLGSGQVVPVGDA